MPGRELSPKELERIRAEIESFDEIEHVTPEMAASARQVAPAEVELASMKKRAPPKKPLREWRISLIRKQGRYLGRVEAPNEQSAIEAASSTSTSMRHIARICLRNQPNDLRHLIGAT
jgi:hypothetical protein